MVVHVESHDFFQREGDTIYVRLPVTMVNAALGAKVEVPTIHGKKTIEIAGGSQSGEVITIRNEGVPHLRGRGRGDMLVELQVMTPTGLCDEQIELLKQFDSLCEERGQHEEQEGFFSKLFHDVKAKVKDSKHGRA